MKVQQKHNIPINTLVEVKYNERFKGGTEMVVHARLFVIGHEQDLDGPPMYVLSKSIKDAYKSDYRKEFEKKHWEIESKILFDEIVISSVTEDMLTVVDVSKDQNTIIKDETLTI